jgi:hypothetical protein
VTTKPLTGRCSACLGAGCALTALTFVTTSRAAEPAVAPAPAAAEPAAPAASSEQGPAAPAQQAAASEPAAAAPSAPPATSEPVAPAAETPAPAARIQIPVPEAPPPVPRTYRVHDGFYVRLNGGIGSVWAKFANGSAAGDVELDGSDMALDLMVGGSPSPGVALGGGLFGNLLLAAEAERDGLDLSDRDVGILVIGPFIDGFPNPKKGWHLGGTLGLALANMNDTGPLDDKVRTTGFGGAAWGEYDAWVGDDWSVGGLVRLGVTRTVDRHDGDRITATSRSITLMFTALYQ